MGKEIFFMGLAFFGACVTAKVVYNHFQRQQLPELIIPPGYTLVQTSRGLEIWPIPAFAAPQ